MARFDSFVVFAAMRTGSNFLEANLNAIPGITCHGEVFNPGFIGKWSVEELFGQTLVQRNSDPLTFLAAMKSETGGMAGFRYFHDHDARVFPVLMADTRCAKVVLTRNPIESYVSWKIARETGQWKLTNAKRIRSARVRFDAVEFVNHMTDLQAFQLRIQHGLQTSGQSAFWIDYDDLQDLSVLNGMAAFLGVKGRLADLDPTLKKQNPEDVADKVENPGEMAEALARLDRFNLGRTPNFEPRRTAMIPGYLAAGQVLYMPVRGGPEARVAAWLAGAGPVSGDFNQRSLRQWMRANPGARGFTVVRHPLRRAAAVLFGQVLTGELPEVRQGFGRTMQIELPAIRRVDELTVDGRHTLLLAWLRFAKLMLAGQTGLRVNAQVATQASAVQGFAQFQSPDLILRENRLADGLAFLAAEAGMPCPALPPDDGMGLIAADAEIGDAARDAYQRDHAAFGFD